MKIHPVNHPKTGGNRFCGPAAISIVTGMTTGEAAQLIRKTSHLRKVTGTSDAEMARALRKCNINMIIQRIKENTGSKDPRPTLTQWLRDSQAIRKPGRVFLVSAGRHWQIISGRRFCCGRVREIVSITDKKANRRARVKAVFELVTNGKPIIIPAEAREKSPARPVDPMRARLKREEKEHGFKGRVEYQGSFADYVVDPCPVFPNGFSTMHHDWHSTYERVMHYANDFSAYEEDADETGHVSW